MSVCHYVISSHYEQDEKENLKVLCCHLFKCYTVKRVRNGIRIKLKAVFLGICLWVPKMKCETSVKLSHKIHFFSGNGKVKLQ